MKILSLAGHWTQNPLYNSEYSLWNRTTTLFISTTNYYNLFLLFSLQSALEKERKRKAGLLSTWATRSSELKKNLRELEQEGEFSNIESKEQLQDVIAKLKVNYHANNLFFN